MKKIVALALGVIFLTGCSGFTADEQKQIEEVDGMVYSFIVGKVEGNDTLLGQVLAYDAQGILVPGRHAYPGDAEEMGEQYEIKRYDHYFHSGLLVYDVTFYRPSTGQTDHYNVAVTNDKDGWLIASNSSVNEPFMRKSTTKENGDRVEPVMVHECKGCE